MSKLINLTVFREFLKSSFAGGIILFSCVILALIVANTPLYASVMEFLNKEVGFESDHVHLKYSWLLWLNDGLMAIFFLLVGLEIKREIVEGELSSPSKAILPILAAVGGALLPAIIYFVLNQGTNTANGWGIPMATDIAFALAVITLLGNKVPASLKIFLAALAIVDDLLAILVIAIFYSNGIHATYLFIALGIFLFLIVLNKLGVKAIWAYLIPGLFIWYFVHHSGIHATIAGVLVAMTLPTTPDAEESPLEKLEHLLTKPVNFIIIPLFAFANTLIPIHGEMIGGLTSKLGIGIIFGLIAGKSIGIFLICYIAKKLKIAQLPEGAGWKQIFGVGLLGGIGFTMSIFISILSFDDSMLIEEAKFAVLIASLCAGLLGYVVLSAVSAAKKTGVID
ncbi:MULTISPECIES: Na+/H+ antiporter NhaA [Sphingobacterium]|uniref:Na+/H+ antiporter NhaA n=2 Tax=Sphingobacterium TaxID=28453 RepID=UPI0008A44F83|nr:MULTISPECIES: Na+/H+ antiporter NhaA [Sphingobacterium]OFV15290.1 sodium:proton antiporter [Sphingobacterium sp. HMSC13C05]OJZ13896.1 MAG: Na+/H+ antiporter NhaA [Sphingobacterium sp. 40-24]QRQ62756.1 Na+/H+ antiporter NhaA [Sphingobacterium multivorum]HAF34211.1 Na+/H+ antiporter NhaA [Sphingobacterium sp.]